MTDCMDWCLLCSKAGTASPRAQQHIPSISMCSEHDPAHILQTCIRAASRISLKVNTKQSFPKIIPINEHPRPKSTLK